MLENLESKIENTGGDIYTIKDDFMFKHLVLDEEEYGELTNNDLSETIDQFDITFVSVKRKGLLKFIHLTSLSNQAFIQKNGLFKNSEYVSDLGIGVYVVNPKDIGAVDNLQTYISEEYDSDEEDILLVRGTYSGDYNECIYGDYHVGYIVLKNNVKHCEIEDVEEISVTDFLLDY